MWMRGGLRLYCRMGPPDLKRRKWSYLLFEDTKLSPIVNVNKDVFAFNDNALIQRVWLVPSMKVVQLCLQLLRLQGSINGFSSLEHKGY